MEQQQCTHMSTDAEHLLEAEPPFKYDLSKWNDFLKHALRYHNAVHPGKDQLIDRINTLRQFMSQGAINQLGSFIEPHPRYRTTEGWDDWVRNATAALKSEDYTISSATTINEDITRFKKGASSDSTLWEALDARAVEGEISSAEQRELFWEAHSWEAQVGLEKECAYFNPLHKVWSSAEPGAAERAEQKLAQLMELTKLREVIVASRQNLVIVLALAILIAALWILVAIAAHRTGSAWFILAGALLLIATPSVMVAAAVSGIKFTDARAKLSALASSSTA